MWIINHKKIFFGISSTLVVAAIVVMSVFGLKFGIDFTGGSLLEISYQNDRPAKLDVQQNLTKLEVDAVLQETGSQGFLIKSPELTDAKKNEIIAALTFGSGESLNAPDVVRFNTIGPTLGSELKNKALVALLVVIVAIIFFIAFAFRHVSTPVSSWKYGFVAIIALVHDVMITLGLFALLGHFAGVEIDTLVVTALLVILGYSINDTIVVLDRVRENLGKTKEKERSPQFNPLVGRSLHETFARSINTSITTLLALLAIYFVGGAATQTFALALIIGVVAGSYSSLFLAAPLLTTFKHVEIKKEEEEK